MNTLENILIVEDELIVARDIRKTLERHGLKVTGVSRTVDKALSLIDIFRPSLVLIDIFLKGPRTGIDLAGILNNMGIPFIYISANSNLSVLEAAKLTSPYGFIVKPFREKDLMVTINIARHRFEQINIIRQSEPPQVVKRTVVKSIPPVSFGTANVRHGTHLIGATASMLKVFHQIAQVARYDTLVLILGETGTGKEGVANCIFEQSLRNKKPFIKINCAAIPAELIESELFGHERGAFTGAFERKIGKFELASGGTLMLDEIGEMTADMQSKLLRVLQEREIQRVGGSVSIKVDVRIIAATSRHLERAVAQGTFRMDLYFRLQVFPIELPALRERKEDIPALAGHFLELYSTRYSKGPLVLEKTALDLMIQYSWPGNIRELQHFMERTVLTSPTNSIDHIVLPSSKLELINSRISHPDMESEKDRIIAALNICNFKVDGSGGAAEHLKMPASLLRYKMKKWAIQIRHS